MPYEYATHGNVSVDGDPSALGDEIQESYSTDLGRPVYGGGGITPDFIVEPAEVEPFLQYLISRNAFFNFAVELNNSTVVEDPSWVPAAGIIEQFGSWLIAEELATEEDLEATLADEVVRIDIERRIHAEVLGAAFGLQERFKVLATADEQIREALERFEQADELLTARLALDESNVAERSPISGSPLN